MSIQITDSGVEVKFTIDGEDAFLKKAFIQTDVDGDICTVLYKNVIASEKFLHQPSLRAFTLAIDWNDVTTPVVASATDVQDFIDGLLPGGSPPPSSGNETIFNEVPSGAINGVNIVFNTAFGFASGSAKICWRPPGGALTPMLPVEHNAASFDRLSACDHRIESGNFIHPVVFTFGTNLQSRFVLWRTLAKTPDDGFKFIDHSRSYIWVLPFCF